MEGSYFAPRDLTLYIRDLIVNHSLKVNPHGDRKVLEGNALAVARHQVGANLRGIDSHGAQMIRFYMKRIKNSTLDPFAQPEAREDGKGNAVVLGNGGFGAVTAGFAAEVAARLAGEHNHSVVAMPEGLNHAGRIGAYTEWVARQGPYRARMTCTADPVVKHMDGKGAYIGTNPISVAQPVGFEWVYVLDIATSNVAKNKIRHYHATGAPIPIGWALDPEGNDTADPARALADGATLTPLGYPGSWIKGFFLEVDVNMEAAAGGNGAWGPEVVSGGTWELTANFGAVLEVRNIRAFHELMGLTYQDYLNRMRRNLEDFRKRNSGAKFPGEIEYEKWRTNREKGILINKEIAEMLSQLGREVGMEPPSNN